MAVLKRVDPVQYVPATGYETVKLTVLTRPVFIQMSETPRSYAGRSFCS